MRLIAALVLAMGFSAPAHAIKFSNQFTEFELPPKWQCNLEGAEWVCQSTDDAKRRDAIVVLAAKLKGDMDTLEQYQEYLKKERDFAAPNGAKVKSNPKYVRVSQLNQQPWVDSLHLESEVPGFYTRYLATVKQDIAVLVTYSINKAKYQDYLPQFEEMVKSLKVFRKAGTGINQLAQGSLFNSNSAAIGGSALFSAAGGDAAASPAAEQKKPAQGGGGGDMIVLLIAAAAVGGFIIWKKKQQSGG